MRNRNNWLLILPATLLAAGAAAQSGGAIPSPAGDFRFLPGGTVFVPPAAHLHEVRTGLRKEAGTSRMKLDIGAMIDLVEYRSGTDSSLVIRAGVELFALALTTSSRGLRLQVDAADGFLGGHITMCVAGDPLTLSARLRLMHLSSHLLDGHYDRDARVWLDGKEPVPFTRDFGELILAAGGAGGSGLRVYAGVHYATLVRPDTLSRWAALAGVEFRWLTVPGRVFGQPAHLYAAVHVSHTGAPEPPTSVQSEAGIRLGHPAGSGVRLYGSWYNGRAMFSQYYTERTRHWGLGVALDVW